MNFMYMMNKKLRVQNQPKAILILVKIISRKMAEEIAQKPESNKKQRK